MNAHAIVFEEPGRSRLTEIELPEPTASDLVVEMLVSGVSVGTERWALLDKRPEIRFPNVPGYMGIGRVLRAGAEAKARGFGEGVLVNFAKARLPAPHGRNSWMGTHLSHAVVNAGNGGYCLPVPDGVDPIEVSLAALCAVAMRGIEMATVPADATVLIAGVGVVGQYALQVCRLKGARVAVTDVVADRLAVSERLGADWVINGATENLAERAKAITPGGFDIIIDTSSVPAVVNDVMRLLKKGGKFVFQGWYPPPSPLDLHLFHSHLPTCYFPCGFTPQALAAVMRWARDGRLNTRALITHRAKSSDAAAIYEMIAGGSNDFLGVVFEWDAA
ncbi:MAG: zinc-binding alcohol dehydrogenase [Kiritimatiellae bacterium]|nr:zinc-binding alcohol dehydrogenase [Kiritimatiellia bacterium]